MKNKNIIILAVLAAALLIVNLVPTGKVPESDSYFADLQYLGFYNVDNTGFGIMENGGAALNTNHVILKFLSVFCRPVCSVNILTFVYLIILLCAFIIVCKAAKGYNIYAAAAFILFLLTKERFMYMRTVLPQGGMFVFFTFAVSMLFYMFSVKRYGFGAVTAAFISLTAFAMYDNVTAICAVILGILLILTAFASDKKAVKAAAVCGGIIVIILSIVFAVNYKGVLYTENVASGVENGVNLYSQGQTAESYTQLAGYYFKNPSSFVKHIQSALNNAFYVAEEAPFSVWNFIKGKFIPTNIKIFFVLIFAALVFLVIRIKKDPSSFGVPLIIISLFVISLMSLISNAVIYGISQMNIRLFGFNAAFDFAFASLVVYIIYTIASKDKELKDKYGITQ